MSYQIRYHNDSMQCVQVSVANEDKARCGVVLIVALGVLSVLVILAAGLLLRSRLEASAAANSLRAAQARWLTVAGLAHARAVIGSCTEVWTHGSQEWKTVFEGREPEVDNDGDGIEDSSWSVVHGYGGGVEGRYAVLVEDECGRLDLNVAGEAGVDGAGWTTFELYLGALPWIGPGWRGLPRLRWGGGKPGEAGVDDDRDNRWLEHDGVDNDGDGLVDESGEGIDEPDEFTAGCPRGRGDRDRPLLTPGDMKMARGIGPVNYERTRRLVTVFSGDANLGWDGRQWRKRFMLNAGSLSGLASLLEEAGVAWPFQKAVNLLDYSDSDITVSVFEAGGRSYYGAESIAVNEVMAETGGVARENDEDNPGSRNDVSRRGWKAEGGMDCGRWGAAGHWSWPFDNGVYRVTVVARTTSRKRPYSYDVEGVTGESFGPVGPLVVEIADGVLDLSIRDAREWKARKEKSTCFDRVVVDAGRYVEIVNLGPDAVRIGPGGRRWRLEWDGGSAAIAPDRPVVLRGAVAPESPFSYLIVADSIYALDALHGDDSGVWGDAPGEHGVLVASPGLSAGTRSRGRGRWPAGKLELRDDRGRLLSHVDGWEAGGTDRASERRDPRASSGPGDWAPSAAHGTPGRDNSVSRFSLNGLPRRTSDDVGSP